MEHFADRIARKSRELGNSVCVGLDPRWKLLPDQIRRGHGLASLESVARAYDEFCQRVIDVVAGLVPAVKPQAAFFEACGPAGFSSLQNVLSYAAESGLVTILDSKRNDIASTAEAYADAAFAGTLIDSDRHPVWQADGLTINPYLGRDAVEPFLTSARRVAAGVFVLVRTSNKGAGQFQGLSCDGRPLFEHVADAVASWGKENVGKCGFGDVGAVVGATHPTELARLRQILPSTIFLVPGYGAQGGTSADIAAAFRADGLGAVVNSSRGIIASFAPEETQWERAVERATRSTIEDLVSNTPMGRLTTSSLE